MINRRDALKVAAATTTSLVVPTIALAEKPKKKVEQLWTFHGGNDQWPIGSYHIDLDERYICFSVSYREKHHALIICDLDDSSIETVSDNEVAIKIAWHPHATNVKLDMNDYQKLKDYVYNYNAEDRLGSYAYNEKGFQWSGKHQIWRTAGENSSNFPE